MNRARIYQQRRFAFLWLPVMVAGVALVLVSAGQAATQNSLTFIGTAVVGAGMAAAIWDWHR